MRDIRLFFEHVPYALPILSALTLVVTLPPFGLWPLVCVGLIPLYFFIFKEKDLYRIFTGVFFFGLIFSGYLSYITLFNFTWIPQAHLFANVVKWFSIPFVIFISGITAAGICLLKAEKEGLRPLERVLLFGIFAVVEWVINGIFMGFNYGSLAYAAAHIPTIRFMASIGGTFLMTFIVVFGNAALAEALVFSFGKGKREYASLIPLTVFATIIMLSFAYQNITLRIRPAGTSSTVSVAIIQDITRKESDAFGTVVNGSFQFPLLERWVGVARMSHPDVIIYPFSPWVGVIADAMDNTEFTTDVIGMDFKLFGTWLRKHIPPKTTFVTWDTRYSEGHYWNEIHFWRDGILVGSYRKAELFPFMDYTPQWARQLGIYSTPYDGSAGTSTAPVTIDGTSIGSLVCSEVSRPESAKSNGWNADILLAIGSEAMFTNSFPNEFNLLNAQLRASEIGRTVIRANKFGPSALIDASGNILQKMPYGQSGVLTVNAPIPAQRGTTPYSVLTEYPFLIALVCYVVFLWFLGFLWSRKTKRPWFFWFLRLRRPTPPER